MGSMLLAAVPSKSSKNTSRIHNPLAFPRHAISTLTPSKCSPIYRRNGRYILRVLGCFPPPLFFGTLSLCKATLATIDVRATRREEGRRRLSGKLACTSWIHSSSVSKANTQAGETCSISKNGNKKTHTHSFSCTSACALFQRQPRDFSINFSCSGRKQRSEASTERGDGVSQM